MSMTLEMKQLFTISVKLRFQALDCDLRFTEQDDLIQTTLVLLRTMPASLFECKREGHNL